MNRNQKYIFSSFLVFSLLLGSFLGLNSAKGKNIESNHSITLDQEYKSLTENLSGADLIIKGKVEKRIDTFKQDSGLETPLGPLKFDVTTYKVKVEKVLAGQLDSDSIVLYQHGSPNAIGEGEKHVKANEKVYLILSKRVDGKGYWSYNFNDGIWKETKDDTTEKNKVSSYTDSEILKYMKNESSEEFEQTIIDAVNKKEK